MRVRGRNRRFSQTARSPLSVLLSAPGAIAFFDTGFGVTKNGSNQCAQLASRIGSHTLDQSTDARKPVHGGVTSPTGRAGLAFTAASLHHMVTPDGTLAGLIDSSQAYSALCVFRQASAGTSRTMWGAGGTVANSTIYEGVVNTGGERVRRIDAGAGTANDGSALGTTITCKTTVFTGSAVSTWLNGTQSLNAAANTRAPACDTFSLGAFIAAGVTQSYWEGDFYCLILSLSQWTTGERTTLERAAKAYWGTP